MDQIYEFGFSFHGVPVSEDFSFFHELKRPVAFEFLMKFYDGDKQFLEAVIPKIRRYPHISWMPERFTVCGEDNTKVVFKGVTEDYKIENAKKYFIQNIHKLA